MRNVIQLFQNKNQCWADFFWHRNERSSFKTFGKFTNQSRQLHFFFQDLLCIMQSICWHTCASNGPVFCTYHVQRLTEHRIFLKQVQMS